MENGRVLEKRFSVPTVSVLPDKAHSSVSSFEVSAVTVPVWSVLAAKELAKIRSKHSFYTLQNNIYSLR
jgi:hypothetical protein